MTAPAPDQGGPWTPAYDARGALLGLVRGNVFQPKGQPERTCGKCGARGRVFVCTTPGCPVNGGAAHG